MLDCALNCVLNRGFHFGNGHWRAGWRRRGLGIEIGGQRAAIEVLQAAPAAMVQLSFAKNALHQVQKAAVLAIDFVGLLQADNAVSAANRAAAGRAEMVAVAARNEFLALAFLAFVDRHVAEAFKKRSMYTPKLTAALPALHPCYL